MVLLVDGNYVLASGGQTSSTGYAITHEPKDNTIWFGVNTDKKAASTGYIPGASRDEWHHHAVPFAVFSLQPLPDLQHLLVLRVDPGLYVFSAASDGSAYSPRFCEIKQEWRESAQSLGADTFRFWRWGPSMIPTWLRRHSREIEPI
jgi:hypothetical protein